MSVSYVVCSELNEETIISYGRCQERDLDRQVNDSNLKVIRCGSGVTSMDHKVVNGKVVERTEKEKLEKRPKHVEIPPGQQRANITVDQFDQMQAAITVLQQQIE